MLRVQLPGMMKLINWNIKIFGEVKRFERPTTMDNHYPE